MVTRLLLLGAMICAVVVVAQGPAPSPPVSVSAQGVERVELRTPAPTCEQAIKEVGLEGQPVHCIEPPTPTYDPPRMHGAYRLFPESYVGPLTYEDGPDTAQPGVVSDDIQALRASSIYVEPAWLPEGYALSSISTAGHDSEHVIAAVYTGPGEPIQVNRVRRSSWPLDVILPAGDSLTVFETAVLEGKAAVLYYPKPGSSLGSDLAVLSFVDGDVETTVLGDHLDPDTATRIALSLICGASCVPSWRLAGSAVLDSLSGASLRRQGDVEAASILAEVGMDASVVPGSGFVDDEHRVVAGLNLTRAMVTNWWHGFDYPGAAEAALDLQHPDGEFATAGVNVYVITWPWSGSGRMFFTTGEYQNIPYGSYCTGRYVNLTDAGGNSLGRLTYVHLANEAGIGDTWYTNTGTWTIRYIGQVAATQLAECVSPYHPHLHQGQSWPSDQITYNTALPQPYGIIDPTNDPTNNWMFKVTLVDSDGDGCSDQEELGSNPVLGGQRDPHNFWDFYDVPVPSHYASGGGGTRDKAIGITTDMVALLTYAGSTNTGSDPRYNVDLDGDGVQDGIEYDRTPSAYPSQLWRSGPPDGGIGVTTDVVAMIKQGGHSCTAPP